MVNNFDVDIKNLIFVQILSHNYIHTAISIKVGLFDLIKKV